MLGGINSKFNLILRKPKIKRKLGVVKKLVRKDCKNTIMGAVQNSVS